MAKGRRNTPPPKRKGGRPQKGRGAGGRGQRGTTPIRDSLAEPGSGSGQNRRAKGPGGERVEGRHAVRELLLAGTRKVREVVFVGGLDASPILDDIRELAAEQRVPVREVGRGAFDALSDTESAQGVLAEAAPLVEVDLDDVLRGTDVPFLVMVDGVTDPHNLGAIFRTADAAGVDAVLLPRHRSVRVSPTVTKTAAGAVEHVPIVSVQGVPAAIQLLQKAEVWVMGLDEAGDRSIFEVDLAREPLCLVLGAEGAGLSRLVRERCDQLVSIPMQGAVASLNVSAAGAVAMFDVARRRMGA